MKDFFSQKGFIAAKNPSSRANDLEKPANCYCDPGFIPDPDPTVRCKKDCEIGYHATGPRCTDINECVLGTHNCALDTGTGARTRIASKFQVKTSTSRRSGQPLKGICMNTEGSYGCNCMPGYDGDGFVCNNLDECGTPDEDCDPLATCVGSSSIL